MRRFKNLKIRKTVWTPEADSRRSHHQRSGSAIRSCMLSLTEQSRKLQYKVRSITQNAKDEQSTNYRHKDAMIRLKLQLRFLKPTIGESLQRGYQWLSEELLPEHHKFLSNTIAWSSLNINWLIYTINSVSHYIQYVNALSYVKINSITSQTL